MTLPLVTVPPSLVRDGVAHRTNRYLNNHLEQDHRLKKHRVNPRLGFAVFATAQRTIQGYKAIHMLRKGQLGGLAKRDVLAQNQFSNWPFGVAAHRPEKPFET